MQGMALIDLVEEKIVRVPLASADKPHVLRELVQTLHDAGEIEDSEAVLRAVAEREAKFSTGLEGGVAVPHGRTHAVTALKLALGIAPHGVDFASIDGDPSRLFFLVVAPPSQAGLHVEALAAIVRLVRSKPFCQALVAAQDAREAVDLIRGA